MPLAFRHRLTNPPSLPQLDGLTVDEERSATVMASLQQRSIADMQARFDAGHRAYIAYFHDQPAAWGWVATSSATIGELKTSFTLSRGDRYLWNFVTLPAFRGRGIYPRLLNAIVSSESQEADRFWIAYAPENRASGSGIARAAFDDVAELSFDRDGLPAIRELRPGGGADASRLLGLAEMHDALARCWRCIRAGVPAERACAAGSCSCDYQRPDVSCAPETTE